MGRRMVHYLEYVLSDPKFLFLPLCIIFSIRATNGSGDWRQRLRASMLAVIESNIDIVLELDERTVQGCVRRDDVGEICGRGWMSALGGESTREGFIASQSH